MRTIALASALALVGGLGLAAPAFAGYYDAYGVYHATTSDYYKSDYYGDRYDSRMNRLEIRQSLRNQGYELIRNLHRVGMSDNWIAVAYIDGDWVRVTIDGDTGTVIDVDNI